MSKNNGLTPEEIAELKAKAAAEFLETEKEALRAKVTADVKAEIEAKAAAEIAAVAEKEKAAVAEKEKAAEAKNSKKFDDDAKKIGEMLKDTSKVRIKVPLDPLNPKQKSATVVINGYKYVIRRGETVEVPEPVATLLEQGGYI